VNGEGAVRRAAPFRFALFQVLFITDLPGEGRAQFHPERSTSMRPFPAFHAPGASGSIWTPAFAGEIGFLNER